MWRRDVAVQRASGGLRRDAAHGGCSPLFELPVPQRVDSHVLASYASFELTELDPAVVVLEVPHDRVRLDGRAGLPRVKWCGARGALEVTGGQVDEVDRSLGPDLVSTGVGVKERIAHRGDRLVVLPRHTGGSLGRGWPVGWLGHVGSVRGHRHSMLSHAAYRLEAVYLDTACRVTSTSWPASTVTLM